MDLSSTTFERRFKKSGAGFTLIELLVVIIIIGVLAAIIYTSYLSTQQSARDSKRKQDLRQIRSALELYREDTGSYPTSLYSPSASCPVSSPLQSGSVVYMNKIPCDPNPSFAPLWSKYIYNFDSDTGDYVIATCLENANDTGPNISKILSSLTQCPSEKIYQLENP